MRQGIRRLAGPIFIIGSYRSGTSALTWALGQHPHIFPLEETHFLYKLAVDLDNLYELGISPNTSFMRLAGYTARRFRSYFSDACNGLIRDAQRSIVRRSNEISIQDPVKETDNVKLFRDERHSKHRWVDGTPENSYFVLPLFRLFPDARFIHILRNPRLVATSLMHFSTMGAHDYAEEDAYRTWTRMAHASALAEQAFGPARVMRLAHEELVSNPQDALTRCLAFVGEEHHSDCLLPLREKMNSSRYDSAGDCSLEANLNSDRPWIREAFDLYERLSQGKGANAKGPTGARQLLRYHLREYRCSLKPETNESLVKENALLRGRIHELEREYRQFSRAAGHIERSLQLLDWGPQDLSNGVPFNMQPNGDNALWAKTRNAPLDTVIVLNEVPLASQVDPTGTLVTAIVPRHMTSQPTRLTMHLYSASCEEMTPGVQVEVTAVDGPSTDA